MALVGKDEAEAAVSIGMKKLKAHGNRGKCEHAPKFSTSYHDMLSLRCYFLLIPLCLMPAT